MNIYAESSENNMGVVPFVTVYKASLMRKSNYITLLSYMCY